MFYLLLALFCAWFSDTGAYFTGKAWLDQFAETIDMNALYFVGTALVIIALIVVCVVVRAWRIANENPVKSIKVE
mgnify:CR=1 FL=1